MKPGSKLLPVGILILVVLAGLTVYQYGYLSLRSEMTATRDMADVRMRTLRKYVSFVAEKPQLQQKLNTLKETRKADESKMIEGQSVTLAAAALQGIMKNLITGRGGKISSERIEKPESLNKLNMVTVTVDATLPDTKALNEVLFATETQTPYLVVREADIRVKDLKDPRELLVRLKVSGIMGGGRGDEKAK